MRSMKSHTGLLLLSGLAAAGIAILTGCGRDSNVEAKNAGPVAAPETSAVSVGVVKIGRQALDRTYTVSSELVPEQEIDVYAKESGFVKDLRVDYGTHVDAGQLMATLEIPELEMRLKQDDASIKIASDMITYAERAVSRAQAQHKVLQLEYERLAGVAKAQPGLVAQQEVDDIEGKALSSEAQVEEQQANLQSAQGRLADAKAKRDTDQALFDYSRITAPFSGVVTQRYANLGTLMQSGMNNANNVLPLVQLSEDDKFRLVIPVAETYVHYIHPGDTVSVHIPSLNETFPGKVARMSEDVREDTRTMHTEVEVLNPKRVLYKGLYAEATITLETKRDAIAVPLQAVDQNGANVTVDVVDSSDKIQLRPVNIDFETPNYGDVISGLQEGDMVVVSDRSDLKPGESVRPKMVTLTAYQSTDPQ